MNRTKALMGTLALLAAIIAGILSADGVFAAYTTCKIDPAVTLSNGVTITMYDTISDSIKNVQQAAYVLHVPEGVTVTEVSYDRYGSLESLSVVADQVPGTYRDITTVTDPTRVQVSAYASIVGAGCSDTSKTTNDWSNNNLMVNFNC